MLNYKQLQDLKDCNINKDCDKCSCESVCNTYTDTDVPVFVKHPLYEKFPIQEWPKGLK